MSWHRARLDWLASTVRDGIDPSTLGDRQVDHFSIPALEETGGPVTQPASEIESGKLRLQGGEVLLSRLNPRKARVVRIGSVGERPAVCSSEFIALVPRAIDGRFLEYLLLSEATRQHLDGAVQSVTRSHQRVRPEVLSKMWVDVPELRDQAAIADYLDAETARIDALIAKKRRMVEILDEKRFQLTLRASSGELLGLATSASKLPWLERHAEGWSVAKLTLVARLGSGHTPSRSHPEWWEDCTIPWITTGEVAQMRSDRLEYVESTRELISEAGVANSAAEIHPSGTVVLSRTASVGYSAIMASPMATSQDFATWTCGPKLRPRFLLVCLRAMRPDLLGRLAMGSTHKTIYMPDIESISVPLPPVELQDRLVDELWRALSVLDGTKELLEKQADLLRERRQALITAAVTGELDLEEVA